METKRMNVEFVLQVIEEEVWKELSGHFRWTETLLEKFQNEVDWRLVSNNENILWTVPMLERFKERINWYILSDSKNETVFTPDNLERYKDYWDWTNLSDCRQLNFSYEIIDKFVDRWDWSKLANNYHVKECIPFGEKFLARYSAYIPVSALYDSFLWNSIVEERKEKLISAILR